MFESDNLFRMSEQSDRLTKARIYAGFKTAKEAVRTFIKHDESLGIASQWKESTYSANESGTAPFSMKRARLYGGAFGVSAEWLYDGSGEMLPNDASQNRDEEYSGYGIRPSSTIGNVIRNIPLQKVRFTHRVPVIGIVEAGAWREMQDGEGVSDTIDCDLPDYRGVELYAHRVKGSSMNEVFDDGGVVIFGKTADLGIQHGDYVVVRRENSAGLAEITVKQIDIDARGAVQLWPRSNDPRWQEPITLPPRNEYAQDGHHIVGVIVDYRPARLRRSGIPLRIHEQPEKA